MRITKTTSLIRKFAFVSIFALFVQMLAPFAIQQAHAGNLNYAMVRFNRLKASTFTAGTVCAKPTTTSQTEAAVAVNFPTGYTVSTTTGNWTTNTTNTGWPKDPTDGTSTATAWPSIGATATSVSGQTVVFTSGDLTASPSTSNWYCFNWTNSTTALQTNSSVASDQTGNVTTCSSTTTCGGTTGSLGANSLDSGRYATATVANTCGFNSNNGCDQIQVSATVPPSFNFSLSSTTAALGTLSTGTPTASSAINGIVSTNAAGGFSMWAADLATTPGLSSTTANKTIAYSPAAGSAASTLSAGSEGFNLGVQRRQSWTGTCNNTTANSDETSFTQDNGSSNTSFKGGGLDGTLRTIANSFGTAASCAVPLVINAAISGTTPAAADYAATITVVAAGRF